MFPSVRRAKRKLPTRYMYNSRIQACLHSENVGGTIAPFYLFRHTMRYALLSLLASIAIVIPTQSTFAAEQDPTLPELDANVVAYLASEGVLSAEIDGSYKLSEDITRAEFIRIVVEYVFPSYAVDERCFLELEPNPLLGLQYELLFNDVSREAPYAMHLCAAMRSGLVWGYTDGTFRPNQTINFAEAAKVLSVAFDLNYTMPMYQTNNWYANYLYTLQQHTAFPASIDSPAHAMSAEETMEILQRIGGSMAAHYGSDVVADAKAPHISSTDVLSVDVQFE